MFSVFTLLIIIAFGLTLVHGINQRVPLWIPVLLMCVALLLGRVAGL